MRRQLIFEKMKKSVVVPIFWGPKMETTSKNDLDPVGPPKSGNIFKKWKNLVHRNFRNDP